MKDSYIGLIKKAEPKSTIATITRCNVQLEELSDETGLYRSLTNALVNITNLDISSNGTGITKVKIEGNYIKDSESELLNRTNILPSRWTVLDTINISEGDGIIGEDNRISFIIKNIPTHPNGYYHKFRFTFLDKNDTPAELLPSFLLTDSEYDGLFNINTFTADPDPEWLDDELAGFSIKILDSNNNEAFISEIPICSNTGDELIISGGIQAVPDFDLSSISKIKLYTSNAFYVLGNDGYGKIFNGINDMNELVGVPEIFAETSLGNWSSPSSSTPVSINKNRLKIKFTNCYKHPAQNLVNGIGNNVSVSSKQFLFVSGYAVYMYVANASSLPNDGNYPGSDNETNGEWFKITEITDNHIDRNIMPYYEYIINDLPLGKNIMIWVGALTPNTKTNLRALKSNVVS